MRFKQMILLLAAGFCTGAVLISSLNQLASRTSSVGGEILFMPMVMLLVWFGWTLRDEYKKVKIRRSKHADTRRR